jgi:hypothetical protein
MPECWNAGVKDSPASAFSTLVNFPSPASAFRHQGQSGTADHKLVRHCSAMENGKSTSQDVSHFPTKIFLIDHS